MKKVLGALLLAAAGWVDTAQAADSPDQNNFFFVQYGQWDSAEQAVIGVNGPGPIHFTGQDWTTFWQLELGDWQTKKDNSQYKSSGEISFGPIGRYYLNAPHSIYFDAVVNIGFITPRYWRGGEQEGTAFDFGGGMALGYRFGQALDNEVSFRVEHFSNGGLRDPNPGRNFFQIRYAKAFD